MRVQVELHPVRFDFHRFLEDVRLVEGELHEDGDVTVDGVTYSPRESGRAIDDGPERGILAAGPDGAERVLTDHPLYVAGLRVPTAEAAYVAQRHGWTWRPQNGSPGGP